MLSILHEVKWVQGLVWAKYDPEPSTNKPHIWAVASLLNTEHKKPLKKGTVNDSVFR